MTWQPATDRTTDTVAALADALLARGWMLATAESCTGGGIAAAATDLAGSSRWFAGGIVSYSNAAKVDLLGVEAAVIDQHGAVCEAVVQAMASGARARLGAQLAVAVSGIAGPGGGTDDKPVGLVWFGWADVSGCAAESRVFSGDRKAVRAATVAHALSGCLERARSVSQ